MKTITITVDVDGNTLSREYISEGTEVQELWGARVDDMLDTLEGSKDVKEF